MGERVGLTSFERNLRNSILFGSLLTADQRKSAGPTIVRRLERFGCFPLTPGEGFQHWVRKAVGTCEEYFVLPETEKRLVEARVVGGAGYNAFELETYGQSW